MSQIKNTGPSSCEVASTWSNGAFLFDTLCLVARTGCALAGAFGAAYAGAHGVISPSAVLGFWALIAFVWLMDTGGGELISDLLRYSTWRRAPKRRGRRGAPLIDQTVISE